MGYHDGFSLIHDLRNGEIRYIMTDAVGTERFYHGLLIHQGTAGKVQNHRVRFHLGDCLRSDHASGLVRQRYMNRNIIALFINIVYIHDMFHVAGQLPRRVYRNIRIVSIYLHSQRRSRVCHQDTDGSQADHAQLLAFDLIAGKLFLLLFSQLLQIFVLALGLYPANSSDNIAGSQQKPCQHQFFHSIGVCSRCIEDRDPLLRTFFQRNVVYSGSCSADHAEFLRQFHIVHHRAADQYGVRIRHIVCLRIVSVKFFQSDLRDRIQAMILKHNQLFSSSNFFINATSASTPSFGIAL